MELSLQERLKKNGERLSALERLLMTRQLEHDQALRQIKECQEKAKEFGVSSLEELEALIARTQEQDQQA